MNRSRRRSEEIDLKRDLVTTGKDIEALQTNRPTWGVGEFRRFDLLSVPMEKVDPKILRRVFPDQPPFEL